MNNKMKIIITLLSLLFINGPCGDPPNFPNILDKVLISVNKNGFEIYLKGFVPMKIEKIDICNPLTDEIINSFSYNFELEQYHVVNIKTTLYTNKYYKIHVYIKNDESSRFGYRDDIPKSMKNTFDLLIIDNYQKDFINKINYLNCDSLIGCTQYKIFMTRIKSCDY